MTRLFPIRLDAEIKHVPWDMLAEHAAQVMANHQRPLSVLAVQDGLTPEEAVAILEDRPFERMACTAATLRLKQLVEEWNGRNTPPLYVQQVGRAHRFPPAVDLAQPEGTVRHVELPRVNLTHGRAIHALELAKSLRDGRRVVNKRNWNELITALEGIEVLTR